MNKNLPKETDVFRDALREFIGLEPIMHKGNKRKLYMDDNLYSEDINIKILFSGKTYNV